MKKNSDEALNESNQTAQDLFNALLKDYYFDMYEVNYTVITDKFDIETKIKNTKQLYCKYHPDFDIKSFDKFPIHFLKDIVKDDTRIYFDNTLILKELYKIIALIDMTNYLQSYITTKQYQRHLKANKNITSQMNNHRKFVLPSSSPIHSRGEHRLNWHFLNNFRKEKKVTNFFLQVMVLTDLNKFVNFYNEENETVEKVLNFYRTRLTQKTTQQAILKSLGILLHHQFKKYLKIGDTKSKEYVSSFMAYIYDTKVNDDEFDRNIYIASTISFSPIFGAKKDKHFIDREKDIIKKLIIKDMRQQNPNVKIEYETIDMFLEQHLKTQHTEYLKKYPTELLKIKEKYSHLKSSNKRPQGIFSKF